MKTEKISIEVNGKMVYFEVGGCLENKPKVKVIKITKVFNTVKIYLSDGAIFVYSNFPNFIIKNNPKK